MTIQEALDSRSEGDAQPANARRSFGAPYRLVEPWQALKMNAAVVLGAPTSEPTWLQRMMTLTDRTRHLAAQDPDVALYMMLQTATAEIDHYSAHHALFCAVVAELCGTWLEWSGPEIVSLVNAALTMNIGMLAMQDAMAKQSSTVSPSQRRKIDEHSARSAELLMSAGVNDGLWLDTVRRHHTPILDGESNDPLQPAQRLAQLLQRVDVFTAKLSRRKSRESSSATVAARDACLDAEGLPDAIGATMLRVLGLYPPGTYVRVASGELAVVVRRGEKAHTPLVACLRRADGSVISIPQLRETSDARYFVKRGILGRDLKMVLNHERVLEAR